MSGIAIEEIEAYAIGTRLAKWAAVGATTIVVRTPFKLVTGETTQLRLNPGESNEETVTVSSVQGREVVISTGLTYAHNAGEIVARQVQTSMIGSDVVDDTKVGNRVPQFRSRQGGSATHWWSPGTTTYTLGAIRMLAGVKSITFSSQTERADTITFPTAFAYYPLVFLQVSSASSYLITRITDITAVQFSYAIAERDGGSISGTFDVHWLAMGTE